MQEKEKTIVFLLTITALASIIQGNFLELKILLQLPLIVYLCLIYVLNKHA